MSTQKDFYLYEKIETTINMICQQNKNPRNPYHQVSIGFLMRYFVFIYFGWRGGYGLWTRPMWELGIVSIHIILQGGNPVKINQS